MKLAVGAMHEADEERLKFAKQLGIDYVIIHTPELRGDGYWEYQDLLMLRQRIEGFGLKLWAIECVPVRFYDKIMQGRPGRDEQIEKFCKTLRNMGRAGITRLAYHWALLGVAYRTGFTPTGRGGAWVTSYNHDLVRNAPVADIGAFDDETVWANLIYFLKAVIPIAEQEGVMLGMHPSDPPVSSIHGVAHILRSVDAYKRLVESVPSPSNGVEFCQGTIAEMVDDPQEVYDAIRWFVSRKKIIYVHFRNIRGSRMHFEETFVDEGKVDMLQAMRTYYEAGYDGVFIDDHTPIVVGDTPWGHRGRAYAIGYMKALIKAVSYYEGTVTRT